MIAFGKRFVFSIAATSVAITLGACGDPDDGGFFATSGESLSPTSGPGDDRPDDTTSGGDTDGMPDDGTTTGPDPSGGPSTTGPDPSGTTTGASGGSATTGEPPPPPPPDPCGDGTLEADEECDGTNFDGKTCADFESSTGMPFTGGNLTCQPGTCTIQTTSCTLCGDGVKTGDEACDGDASLGPFDTCFFILGIGYDGAPTCADDCTIDTSTCVQCGDGVLSPGEVCDGDVGAETCETQGFDGGTLACGGNCQLDTSACFTTMCGDGVKTGEELCDGTDVGSEVCAGRDNGSGGTFDGGPLGCNETCDGFDESACTDCGNGTREDAEDCDGSDIGGVTCEDVGFLPGATGSVSCNANCTYNINNCNGTRCGAPNGAPADGAGACGTDWSDGATGCTRDCAGGSCASPIECPADRSCDLNCTDGTGCTDATVTCAAGHTCDVSCTALGSCSNATIDCPPDADCHVTCDATNGCNGATVNCPSGNFECVLSCAGAGSCANVDMVCNGGPCRVECGEGSNACDTTDVACGSDACEATCTGTSSPNLTCNDSCGCTPC